MPENGFITRRERLLRERMQGLGVREEDIQESFIASSGPGGQNVNKVASCVYLKHIPTGIEVKCQKERTQGANRYAARVILCAKLEARAAQASLRRTQERERLRRQNRRPSRAARLRMLEDKRRNSLKKKMRQRVRSEE